MTEFPLIVQAIAIVVPLGTQPINDADPFGPERKFRQGLTMIFPEAVGAGGGEGGGAGGVTTIGAGALQAPAAAPEIPV